jgi:hypothetical protein
VTNVKQHREPPDLIRMIADINRRLTIQEQARRLGNASIDGGALYLRNGDIQVVDADGNPTLVISHGATPAITFIPGQIEGGYSAAQFAWESDTLGATFETHMEDGSGNIDGGKLLLNKSTAYLSHQPHVGNECYVAVGQNGIYPEHFRLRGRWVYNDGFDSQDAVVAGFDNVAAGFGASSYAFPYTFDQIPIVVYSIQNAGTAVAHDLSAVSTTGFTIAWASGTTAKVIGWMAFRR